MSHQDWFPPNDSWELVQWRILVHAVQPVIEAVRKVYNIKNDTFDSKSNGKVENASDQKKRSRAKSSKMKEKLHDENHEETIRERSVKAHKVEMRSDWQLQVAPVKL